MQNWFINQFRKNQSTAFTHIKKKKKEKERKEKVTKNAELELREKKKKNFWSAFPIFFALHDTF